MSKKMMNILLTLLFTCVAFFGLGEFGVSMSGSCYIPRTLVESLPGSSSHFSQYLHKIKCCSLFQIHREIAPQIKGAQRISTSAKLLEILYIDSQDMLILCILYYTIHITAPAPEIMFLKLLLSLNDLWL
jgi:hypothetical protein